MDLLGLISLMRRNGIRSLDVTGGVRVADGENAEFGGPALYASRIELSDTIPAPPPSFEATELDEPQKPPGTCIALGCSEPGGWHFDTRYCGPHGRAAAGVKP